jgi:hypothetical protein
MARVFAYLMSGDTDIEITDEAIFKDVSQTVYLALSKVNSLNPSKKGLIKNSLESALSQLV